MVQSSSISITPANHADNHRTGGSDPLTGAVGIDSFTHSPHTTVHNGAITTAYQDIDLSAVVGANIAIVTVSVTQNAGTGAIHSCKQKGAPDVGSTASDHHGANHCFVTSTTDTKLMVVTTDASGIIEWKSSKTDSCLIIVESFVR